MTILRYEARKCECDPSCNRWYVYGQDNKIVKMSEFQAKRAAEVFHEEWYEWHPILGIRRITSKIQGIK